VTPRPLIFISAVSRELHSARQLVANTLTFLGYQPIWQEIFGTESGDLREMLRKQIDQCKGVVQLIGKCYGAEPPTPDEKFGRVSYTQYEALYARERGKKVWYLFIDENFPRDPCEDEPEERKKLQADYRSRLQSDTHVFHSLVSHEALEAGVLKLRDDLSRLRRGVKRWALGVTALLLFVSIAIVWLVQAQRRQSTAIQRQGEQVSTVVDRYQKMEQALVRLAEVEGIPKRPEEQKMTPEEQRARAYAYLERELGLSQGSLSKELPGFALELYTRNETTPLLRARAAYALGKFDEAKQFSLEGAEKDRQAFQTAQRVAEDRRKRAVESYELAGWASEKRIQYSEAMQYFGEAEKLTDEKRDPREWCRVQDAIGALAIDQGDYTGAERVFRNIYRVLADVDGAQHPLALKSRSNIALVLTYRGKYKEAESEQRQALTLQENALGHENRDVLQSRKNIGQILDKEGRAAEAEAWDRTLIASEEKILGPEDPLTIATHVDLANALIDEDKNAEAESEVRMILRVTEKIFGPAHPTALRARTQLANLLNNYKKSAEAEAEYREILRLTETTLGTEHPATADAHQNLGVGLQLDGKYAEAEAEYRRALAIDEKVRGSSHDRTLGVRQNLAVLFTSLGNYRDAEAECRRIVDTETKTLGPEHPGTLAVANNLADVLNAEGKSGEAETVCRETLRLKEKVLGREHVDTLITRNTLASALNGAGKASEAEVEARSTLDQERRLVGAENELTLDSWNSLAIALGKQRKFAEAEIEFQNLIKSENHALGLEHPMTVSSENEFAKMLIEEGKDAEQLMSTVIKSREKLFGAEHPFTLDSCYHFALGLRRQGRIQQAQEFARRAAEGAHKLLGAGHPETQKYAKLVADLERKP
jgi:tetratricopeptide (TPR) repeat protein